MLNKYTLIPIMRKIVILGSGAGGTMVAANLRKELDDGEWQITLIDKDEQHHFQSGYLFIPFGIYSKEDVLKPKRDFVPKGVDFVVDNVIKVDTEQRRLETKKGDSYDYDWLVISTGCRIVPEEVEGMMDVWREDVFDFYTLDGAVALSKKLKYFDSGKVVLNIAEFPYKCPIAPMEFVFMADWFFQMNGVRDKVEIEFVTPIDNIFTKPVAAKALRAFADKKNIKVTPYFDLAKVNANEKTIESHKGDKVGYDLLAKWDTISWWPYRPTSAIRPLPTQVLEIPWAICRWTNIPSKLRMRTGSMCWGMPPTCPPPKQVRWHIICRTPWWKTWLER
jgi:sulfide:quinone oxidoreductase